MERITKILDEAIYKCKLAICLPDLVAEYKTLSSVLSTTHMDDLIFIFDQYDNPLFSASVLNMAAIEDLKAVSHIRYIFKKTSGCSVVGIRQNFYLYLLSYSSDYIFIKKGPICSFTYKYVDMIYLHVNCKCKSNFVLGIYILCASCTLQTYIK